MTDADPVTEIGDAARDEWADSEAGAQKAISALLGLVESDWEPRGIEATQMLRAKRADSALLLAATEVALEPNPLRAADGLREMLIRLEDTGWCAEIGMAIVRYASVGVLSLGSATVKVLEAAVLVGGATPELFCDKRAIARGLGLLDVPIMITDPAHAEVLLLPVAAQHKERIWTTPHNADVAQRARASGRRVIPVRHPLASLSPLNRLAYRPRPFLVDVLL